MSQARAWCLALIKTFSYWSELDPPTSAHDKFKNTSGSCVRDLKPGRTVSLYRKQSAQHKQRGLMEVDSIHSITITYT